MVKYVTFNELEELIAGEKPVVCDFWATSVSYTHLRAGESRRKKKIRMAPIGRGRGRTAVRLNKVRRSEAKIKRCIFMTEFRGTTICAVKRDGVTAIAGDGQVTMGESVIFKNSAVKVRRISVSYTHLLYRKRARMSRENYKKIFRGKNSFDIRACLC